MTSKRHDGESADARGKAVPPYEGRQKSGHVGEEKKRHRGGPRTGGATGPVQDRKMKARNPEDTPRGATGSPADEKAARRARGAERKTDRGTGPAHQHGVPRGEDHP